MKKEILFVLALIFVGVNGQNHRFGIGINNFANYSISYERIISSNFNLRYSFTRSMVDGYNSNRKVTYDYSSLSAKIYNDISIFDFEFFHGPSVLVGYFYEYDNFRVESLYYPINNSSYLQESAMISPQYIVGFEREFSKNMYGLLELTFGGYFLYNEQMTILEKYELGDWVPYIGFNLQFSYNYPDKIF